MQAQSLLNSDGDVLPTSAGRPKYTNTTDSKITVRSVLTSVAVIGGAVLMPYVSK